MIMKPMNAHVKGRKMMKNVTCAKQSINIDTMRVYYFLFAAFLVLMSTASPVQAQTPTPSLNTIANNALNNVTNGNQLADLVNLNPNILGQANGQVVQNMMGRLGTGGISQFTDRIGTMTGAVNKLTQPITDLMNQGLMGQASDMLASLSDRADLFRNVTNALNANGILRQFSPRMLSDFARLAESFNIPLESLEGLRNVLDDLGGLQRILENLLNFGDLFDLGFPDLTGLGGPIGRETGGGDTTAATGALPESNPMSTTCDPDIMQSIETRAWLEAEREVVQNANLIAKPDSVLEYSCFNQFLAVLGQQADGMFSDNTDVWRGTVDLVDSNGLDTALNNLVATPMNAYISNNFNHSYLGGRGPAATGGPAGTTYTCSEMNTIWNFAKCTNFAVRPEDSFLTFAQHASTDVRTLPQTCGAQDPRWETYIPAAFEDDRPWYETYDETYTEAFNETARMISPVGEQVGEPPEEVECHGPVFTGLVYYVSNRARQDGVCTNPGCYYAPGTGGGGGGGEARCLPFDD